jgi:hypothetical protein
LENLKKTVNGAIIVIFFFVFVMSLVYAATPVGPSTINSAINETKTAAGAYMLNTSGGYITTLNISSTTQNPRWKAFVGRLTGRYTLDDASGATIYDWSSTSVSGQVFATRNSSTIVWSNIACATNTQIENENRNMSLSSSGDNITATFRGGNSNPEFFVANINISLNSCNYTLNTYVNNATQTNYFKEVALSTYNSIVFATILEQNRTGFDSNQYEFQMIVPENGAIGFSGATAYYLYVELT